MPPRRVRDQELLKQLDKLEENITGVEAFMQFCAEMSDSEYHQMNRLWLDFEADIPQEDMALWVTLLTFHHQCALVRQSGNPDLGDYRGKLAETRAILSRKLIALKTKEDTFNELLEFLKTKNLLQDFIPVYKAQEAIIQLKSIAASIAYGSCYPVPYDDAVLPPPTEGAPPPCWFEYPSPQYLEHIHAFFVIDSATLQNVTEEGHLAAATKLQPKCPIAWRIQEQISLVVGAYLPPKEEHENAIMNGSIACTKKLLELNPGNLGLWVSLASQLDFLNIESTSISGNCYTPVECLVKVLKVKQTDAGIWEKLSNKPALCSRPFSFTLDGSTYDQNACIVRLLELCPDMWYAYYMAWNCLSSPFTSTFTVEGTTFNSNYGVLKKCMDLGSLDVDLWVTIGHLLEAVECLSGIIPPLMSVSYSFEEFWRACEMVVRGELQEEKALLFWEGKYWNSVMCYERAVEIYPTAATFNALLGCLSAQSFNISETRYNRRQCCDLMQSVTGTIPWANLATTVAFGELVRDVQGKDYTVGMCIEQALLDPSTDFDRMWKSLFELVIPKNDVLMINGKPFSRFDAIECFTTMNVTRDSRIEKLDIALKYLQDPSDGAVRRRYLPIFLEGVNLTFSPFCALGERMQEDDDVLFEGILYNKSMCIHKSLEMFDNPKNPSWLGMCNLLKGTDKTVTINDSTFTYQDCEARVVWCAMLDAASVGLSPPPPDFETAKRQRYRDEEDVPGLQVVTTNTPIDMPTISPETLVEEDPTTTATTPDVVSLVAVHAALNTVEVMMWLVCWVRGWV